MLRVVALKPVRFGAVTFTTDHRLANQVDFALILMSSMYVRCHCETGLPNLYEGCDECIMTGAK